MIKAFTDLTCGFYVDLRIKKLIINLYINLVRNCWKKLKLKKINLFFSFLEIDKIFLVQNNLKKNKEIFKQNVALKISLVNKFLSNKKSCINETLNTGQFDGPARPAIAVSGGPSRQTLPDSASMLGCKKLNNLNLKLKNSN
ncbi:hypothetical protein BpHYR1_007074 [Brachionus plicatilis]|uniref:Uncharacterized protein n=1 Tax=Brachionus plicatilis TaxID=10195 RepID=A0A3M7PL51_BRAPC|nr:hypothetical protein BpHYR1_007074 [Brachionus plicatilis]